jgi:stalled ribosome rescue protein Dom34
MTTARAIVRIDHRSATLLTVADGSAASQTIHAHSHPTAQHGSSVRTEHEFFGAICDGVDRFAQVLAAGPQTALADLRHYLEKHRPHTATRVVGFEVVDHPTDNQLVALARQRFAAIDRMAGLPTPG